MFFIGDLTVGPTELKFGMEDHIFPWEVIGYISYWPFRLKFGREMGTHPGR